MQKSSRPGRLDAAYAARKSNVLGHDRKSMCHVRAGADLVQGRPPLLPARQGLHGRPSVSQHYQHGTESARHSVQWLGSQGGKYAVRRLRRQPHLLVECLQLPVSPVQLCNLVHVLGPSNNAVQVAGFHGSQGLACLSLLPHALLVGKEYWEELCPVLGDLVPALAPVRAAALPKYDIARLLAAFTIHKQSANGHSFPLCARQLQFGLGVGVVGGKGW